MKREESREQARERLVSLARSGIDDPEVTVYVKGFLGRGEEPDHFGDWLASHRDLVDTQGWGPRAHGFCWESGRLERLPLPAASFTKLAYDVYRRLRHARGLALLGSLGPDDVVTPAIVSPVQVAAGTAPFESVTSRS